MLARIGRRDRKPARARSPCRGSLKGNPPSIMFRALRLRQEPAAAPPTPHPSTIEEWLSDAQFPIGIRTINSLSYAAKQRVYRLLVPPVLLTRFGINPVHWRGADYQVELLAEPESPKVQVAINNLADPADPYFVLELQDNAMNGIDLNLILLNDPTAEKFGIDRDAAGSPTHWGTVRRNLAEEERARQAGLAPAQVRAGLGYSRQVLDQLDVFLAFSSRQAVSLEPLTYASAWIFERRGFAYVRGHKLMDDIHREFEPGGKLYAALDGSTPFRQPGAHATVRGRAWAIQDGILEVLGANWRDLRMIKVVGKHAGVETFPGAKY